MGHSTRHSYNTQKCHTDGFDKQDGTFCWAKECGGENPPSDCFDASQSPILCQHGEGECNGDTLEGCVFAHSSLANAMAFLYCFEGENGADMSSAKDCASKAGVDYDAAMTCYNGPQAAKVDAHNAKLTAALGDSKLGTPWVMLNGQNLQDPSTLLHSVCQALNNNPPPGGMPAGCSNLPKLHEARGGLAPLC